MSIPYRPEIDGLRALAVSVVLLCHANFTVFSGGYVGVDIFFVISGFLITSLIANELRQGTFSFLDFWERRIRRILPALFVVIIPTLIAGWFLHLPADYDLLGQQVAAQSVFSSNILFKSQAGYFDQENIVKPLLHTWSLSVEEQFYIFFPIAMFWLWRKQQSKISAYLFGFAFVSCVWGAIITHNSPPSAFFLLPFRAWELLLGSLLALQAGHLQLSRFKREFVGGAGLLLILFAVFICTEETVFPFAALPACLGAVLIIISNDGGATLLGRLLSARAVVFVGLISYSLYLWHWPIMSFVRYTGFIPFTPLVGAGCIAASFVLAVLSWKFVETPFRRKIFLPSTRQAYIAAFSALALFGVSGLAIHFTNGVPARLDPQVVRYAAGIEDTNPHRDECDKPDADRFKTDDLCQTNPGIGKTPTFIVWGDSFGDALAPLFYDLSEKYKKNGFVVTAHGCMPAVETELRSADVFDCAGHNELVLKLIQKNNIKNIILISNWTGRIDRNNEGAGEELNPDIRTPAIIERTIDQLQAQGRRVFVMLDVPYAPFDPPRYLAFSELYGRNQLRNDFSAKSYLSARKKELDPLIGKLEKKGVVIIDPMPMVCADGVCEMQRDGFSLYYNQGHFSRQGALYLNPLFEPYFKKDF